MIRGVLALIFLTLVAVFFTSDYISDSISLERSTMLPLVMMGVLPMAIVIGLISSEDKGHHQH